MRQDVKNIDQCARCEEVSKDGARELVSSLEFRALESDLVNSAVYLSSFFPFEVIYVLPVVNLVSAACFAQAQNSKATSNFASGEARCTQTTSLALNG